ncbi:hypothetical protein GIB67_027111 [Kingdonia uniflora]|uniref:N-acetyltransferase domain-containing protein n=1 Tax=Kingdonia uniflora TaxID=39325 RepID=A0A7J7P1U4_9MAGN|nr:hypothetical protein GIB67_027111 [Kingdonia uniflora]
MERHSLHSTAPRSSHSPSQSHSASASVSSSTRKRKLATAVDTPPFPFYSDELESGSTRGADTDPEEEYSEEVDDDNDSSVRVSRSSTRLSSKQLNLRSHNKVKVEMLKIVSSSKDEGGGGDVLISGAYIAREENCKKEEEAGRLKFVCVSMDGIDEHMIWLMGLKNIFARQLPNMPKEYIVRLVMDRNHKSLVVIRTNQVVGGITYRPFTGQKFGEISFCAIASGEQVKGYGTRLMNHLKQHAREVDGLTHFLTYADNNAVEYFIKQVRIS